MARAVRFVGGAIAVLALLCGLVAPGSVTAWEADETATVTRVIDGDTFDSTPSGRVRLADVDTPELGEPGYQEAKDFLSARILNRTVLLDVDDKYRTDPYSRLVCVTYVRHNETHYLNVNKALLDAGLARIAEYDNEFTPGTWTLYVTEVSVPPPDPPTDRPQTFDVTWLIAAALVAVGVLAAVLGGSRRRRRRRA